MAVFLERSLLVAGTVLLAFYGAARLDGWLFSTAALQAFDRSIPPSPRDSLAAPTGPDQSVDMSLWSPERVVGFRDTAWLTEERALGVIELDRLALRVPVFEGTDDVVLNRGAGWIQGTARPGEDGNIGVAAHRDGFFRVLMHVRYGDSIRVLTPATTQSYRVDDVQIVGPENVEVLLPRAAPSITLVTCYPFYFSGNAPQRFIVHATLESEALVGVE